MAVGLFRRRNRPEPGTTPEDLTTADEAELVTLSAGRDRFVADAAAARCQAEGIPVRVLDGDGGLAGGGGLFGHPVTEHRLLVRASDRDRVEQILSNH